MAINNRFPMGAAPQDPRKKRPLSPLEDYPYEPEVFDPSTAPRPLPDLPMPTGGAMAVPPITPGLNRPGGPENFPYTPPRDFTQFRQYYLGLPVDPVGPDEVMPPAPDWGKKTPTYSRMNPPPPKRIYQGGRVNIGQQAPVQQGDVLGRPQTFFQQAQQAMRQPAPRPVTGVGRTFGGAQGGAAFNQPVRPQAPTATPRPTGGRRSIFEVAGAPAGQPGTAFPQRGAQGAASNRYQQQYTLPQAMQNAATAMGQQGPVAAAQQFLPQTGIQQAAEGTLLNRQWRDVPRDMGLAIAAGVPRIGAGFASLADMIGRTSAAAPVGQPGASYAADTTRPAAPTSFGQTARSLEQMSEGLLGMRSQSIQQREQAFNADLDRQQDDALGQVATYAAAIYKDPALVEKAILSNLPQIFPALAAGKIASVAGTGAALAARVGTGALMGGADAVNSIYETNKQALLGRGLSEAEADREAFRQSIIGAPIGAAMGGLAAGTGFEAGFSGGGLGARLGQGMRGMASRIPQAAQQLGRGAAGLGGDIARRLAPGVTEIATEIPEETIPQIIGNVQSGQPAMRNVGRTAAETAVATGPFAIAATIQGGAAKNPDAIQSETSSVAQQYSNWVTQGGVRAPESWTPPGPNPRPGMPRARGLYADTVDALPEPAELTGRRALPPAPPQLGGQPGLPPAPTRPSAPGAAPPPQATPPQPTTTAQPTPSQPAEEEFEGLFRPARPGYLSPKWSPSKAAKGVLYGITGPQEEVALDTQLELERAKYAERMQDFESGAIRRRPAMPTGPTLKGKYGQIANAGNRAPNFGMRKLKEPYGIPPETNVENIYGPVMSGIASEMGEILGRDISINEMENAASAQPRTNETAGIWDKWYERYGADYGLDEDDLWSLKDSAFGKGRGGFFDNPDLQLALTGDRNQPEINKSMMDVIREDMARLLGLPETEYPKISLSRLSPDMWRLWARSNELDNEKRFPGLMASMERMIARGSDLKTRDKGLAPDKVDRKTTIPRATTQAPPAPVAPPRPSREGELGRYRGMTQVGVPRAPLSMVPGVPSRRQGPGYQLLPGGRTATTGRPQGPTEPLGGPPALRGVPPTTPPPAGAGTSEAAERQAERQRREALKKRSPFAAAKEREQARATEATRRPPTPPAAPKPTTAPATGRKPVNLKTLEEAGWTQETSQRFTHPDGRVIERDSGSSGRKAGWYSTDASGNQAYHEDLRGAILAATEGQAAAPAAPVTPPPTEAAAPKPQRAKKQAPAAPTTPAPTPKPKAKATPAAKAAEPTPTPTTPTPTPAAEAGKAETASESDKAIFEDVDANKNKKGAKSRIKQAYGTRGTKAIFIEDNINQILQEAEENGKVTKICPD